MKIIGGDYVGYRITFGFKGITLKAHGNVINITKSDIARVEILDQQEHTSGIRMAVKSKVFSSVGLGGLWGGLSARAKVSLLVGIELVSGRTIMLQTNQSGYRKILRYTY